MKSKLIISLFFLFAFACEEASLETTLFHNPIQSKNEIPAIEIHKEDLLLSKNIEGKILYKKHPFSGYVFSTDYDNILQSKVGYFEGLKEGKALTYYAHGSIASERLYASGKKHGMHKAWYKNKQIRFQYTFVNGKSEGNHKVWYEDGGHYKDFNFKNGKPFGSQKVWRKDGKYRANYVIRENGKKYGLTGLRRCSKIDTKTENIDPYTGTEE